MNRHISIICCLLLLFSGTHAQREGNIWYFGEGAGLDFNSGAPVALTNGAMITAEGCSSIADSLGNLLFYTDGISVWNSNHVVMNNGNGLEGHYSSTQSAVIIPNPADKKKYYIFTMDFVSGASSSPSDGLHYSEVDMNLQGGLGDVTTIKNVPLFANCTEKLTAVRHANGTDFWILAHELNSANFLAYAVTPTGVSAVPVVSSLGTFHPGAGPAYTWIFGGYLKASHQGDRIANVSGQGGGIIDLFDFDNTTGTLTNYIGITSPAPNGVYGVEFSPDGSYLYVSSIMNGIYQLDLTAGSLAAINGSATMISPATLYGGALQLGPDQKIYCAGNNAKYLHTIHNPNAPKLACNFVLDDVYLGGKESKVGLPNFLPRIYVPFITYQFTCQGDSTYFTISDITNLDSVRWDFGDPASGLSNFSSLTSPKHVFSDTGTYIVQAIIDYSPAFIGSAVHDTIYDTLRIVNFPVVDLGPDTTHCGTIELVYNVTFPGTSYQWQNNDTTALHTVKSSGVYWVELTNSCGSNSDTVVVNYIDSVKIPFQFEDTTICVGSELVLDVSQSTVANYLWQDSSTNPIFIAKEAGMYWVEVTNACDMESHAFVLNIRFPPEVYLGEDTTLCRKNIMVLDAGNVGSSYLWQDGSTGQYMHIVNDGIYWVEVSNNCAVDNDSLLATLSYPPVFDLGEDTIICEDDQLMLNAYNKASTYVWQDQSTNPFLLVEKRGTYEVRVKNACGIKSDIIEIGEENCNCSVYVPNTFTPNNDQVNDYFKVHHDCEMQAFEWTIYNRWGEIVYYSTHPSASWDGSSSGTLLPIGAYAWTLHYQSAKDKEGKDQFMQGTVRLIR